MKKELSIIIPAYNEETHIRATLLDVGAYFRRKGYRFEILVVDDGSTDETRALAEDAAKQCPEVRIVRQPENRGKGEAVKRGIREAVYGLCLFMDADNSTTVHEWDKFESFFESGSRAVIASRHLPGSQIEHPQPFMRRWLGSGYRTLCRALFAVNPSDFNCGFKAYETEAAKKVFGEAVMRDWTFDAEIFCLMKKYGIPFDEVPVRWSHFDKASHSSPLTTARRTLKSVFRLKRMGY